ncbi:hypothetical protein D3C80_1796210 [compost metagenome]
MAGMHAISEFFLADVLSFHRFGNLPSDNAFEGGSRDFLSEPLLGKKIVEIRTDVFVHAVFLIALLCAVWRYSCQRSVFSDFS